MTGPSVFRTLLFLGLALSQSVAQDSQSCINSVSPDFNGNVTDSDSCITACDSKGAQSAVWDRVNGTLVNNTAFRAWRCTCESNGVEEEYCTSIVYGDGEPGPPPPEPFNCWTLKVTNIGRCGLACEIVYPRRFQRVNYTQEKANGDTYRECQCILNNPNATETFCQGTTLATSAPTTSPIISIEPTTSQMPTIGLQNRFPSASPSEGSGEPVTSPSPSVTSSPSGVTSPPSGTQTTPTPVTLAPTTQASEPSAAPTSVGPSTVLSESPTQVSGNTTLAPTLVPGTTLAPTAVPGNTTIAPSTTVPSIPSMAPSTSSVSRSPSTAFTSMAPSDTENGSFAPSEQPSVQSSAFSSGFVPMAHITVVIMAFGSAVFIV